MFAEIFENAAERCAENFVECEGDYISNGILHCGKCNTPKQSRIKVFGKEQINPCDCKCMMADYEKSQLARKEQEQLISVNNL